MKHMEPRAEGAMVDRREMKQTLTIEHLRAQRNICDREMLEKLLPDLLVLVKKDRFLSLYGALVGDYTPFSEEDLEGTKNLGEARKKYFERWSKDPHNETWHDGIIDLVNEETEKGNFMRRERNMGDDDEPRTLLTTHYHSNQDFIVYDTSRVDGETGKTINKREEPHTYRVYFNFKNEYVAQGFRGIIDALNADPDMAQKGFQIKTLDLYYSEPNVDNLHRRDKVVLYLTNSGIDVALPILQKFIEDHREYLQDQGVFFAQPFLDSHGKNIGGVGVTSEQKLKTPDKKDLNGNVTSTTSMKLKSFNVTVEAAFEHAEYLLCELCTLSQSEKFLGRFTKDFGYIQRLAQANPWKRGFLKELLQTEDGQEFFLRVFPQFLNKKMQELGFLADNIAFQK